MARAGHVSLVGAGPGDPDLITVGGVEALRAADAVVYDYLAPEALLQHAPPDAERIYVGKRAGSHTLSQEAINALLVRLAVEGRRVVRLKGGDPFVFGRGGEEALALAEAGVPFDVIPGVTSAVAVPAYAGIPVTQRGLSSSVAFVTGHEDPTKPESALDWGALARVDTLVVLMGVGNLPETASHLIAAGRDPGTPAAVIERGTTGTQRSVRGTLGDIAERVGTAGLRAPAVIVVGEVASLAERLSWFEGRPLAGLRVLVTRTREQAGLLSASLRELGAEPVECPLIETAPPESWEGVDRAIERLDAYHWVLFTSANGVKSFMARLLERGRDARALAGARIGAIGTSTARALLQYSLRADRVPEEYVAEALADALGDVQGQSVLLATSSLARSALPERLRTRGALVDVVTAYRTMAPHGLTERLRRLVDDVDVVTFTSSSTVQHFAAALDAEEVHALSDRVRVACIGPITADAARELGLRPEIIAREYTIEGLVQALVDWRQRERNGVRTTP